MMKNHSVDKLKAIACYLVVLNHFHPGGVFGEITYTISHFGVPLFFLVSGYYLLDKNSQISAARLWKKVKHIGLLLLGHIILYAFYEVVSKLVAGAPINSVLTGIKSYFSGIAIVKAVFLGTGIMGGGEWFLVSLLEAYVVIGIIMLSKPARHILTDYAHVIAVLLLLVHIPVRYYCIKMGIDTFGPISLVESYAVRNTWLDAIPFLLLGVSIRENAETIKISHPLAIAFFAMIVGIGEHFYNLKMIEPYSTHDVLYFGTIVAVIMAFNWAINNKTDEDWLTRIGARYSMMIYFLHPIVGWLLQSLIGVDIISINTVAACVFSIVIMSMTTLITVTVYWTKRKITVKG